jgi:hypothetical protein
MGAGFPILQSPNPNGLSLSDGSEFPFIHAFDTV